MAGFERVRLEGDFLTATFADGEGPEISPSSKFEAVRLTDGLKAVRVDKLGSVSGTGRGRGRLASQDTKSFVEGPSEGGS